MATKQLETNVKVIRSNTAPTTATLPAGCLAFGNVGGVPKLYGNQNGTAVEEYGATTLYTGTGQATDGAMTQKAATDALAAAWKSVYPVGAIYQSTASTSPASLIGGTWASFGQGRVLVGSGTSDASYTAGTSGGESKHTLTVAEMPSHGHGVKSDDENTPLGCRGGGNAGYQTSIASYSGMSDYLETYDTGGGGSHNNMPPYIVVYRWQRTA
jgi:hypothetical protein